jgi:hypothetical protein
VVVLAVLALLAAALILLAGRGTIFFFDEWNFVLDRRGSSVGTFLDPHEGHLVLVPVLIYKALFAVVGLEPYWPYRAVAVAVHLIVAGLLYGIARRRLGPWPAVAVATLMLFLGSAWEVLLWPFQLAYLCSVVGGLGAWLALQERGRARDAAACLLVLVALASSGVGVAMALGLLVALLLDPQQRRRAWTVVGPLLLYAIWFVAYAIPNPGASGGAKLSNLPDVPGFAAKMAAVAAGGIAGIGLDWGQVFLALFAIAVVARLLRRGLSPWLAAGLVMCLAFWALTALGRADVGDPASSRYIYPSAVFLLLVAVELPGSPLRPSRMAWVLGALAVFVAALGNTATLRNGGRELRSHTNEVMPALAAVEVGDGRVAAGYRPELQTAPQVYASGYLDAVRDLGTPLPTGLVAQLRPPANAAVVDGRLVAAEHLALMPPDGAPALAPRAPRVIAAVGGRATTAGGCVRLAPAHIPAALDLAVPAGRSLVIRSAGAAPAEVRLRRFGPDYPPEAIGSVPPRATRVLGLPRDASSTPWAVRISPSRPVVACLAG